MKTGGQNVDSEKSDRSLSFAIFFLPPLCYFNAEFRSDISILWILGRLKHDPKLSLRGVRNDEKIDFSTFVRDVRVLRKQVFELIEASGDDQKH